MKMHDLYRRDRNSSNDISSNTRAKVVDAFDPATTSSSSVTSNLAEPKSTAAFASSL